MQRLADGAGGAVGFQLLDHQRAGLQRCGFGDAGSADGFLDIIGGGFEAVALLQQLGGREQTERHLEVARRFKQRRLVGLDVDRGNGRKAFGGEVLLAEGEIDKADDLLGVGAPLTTNAGDQRFGVIDDAAFNAQLLFGDQHLDRAQRGYRVAGFGEERRLALDLQLGAEQQGHHRGLGILRGAEHPAGGRFVEAMEEFAFRRGGDGGVAAQLVSKLASQPVGAAVAAEQRHDAGAAERYGEHRRFFLLVLEARGKEPDQDAGSADANDRTSLSEQPRQQLDCVGAALPAGIDFAAGCFGDAGGGIEAGIGERDDGGGRHAPAPVLSPQASVPR